MDFHSLPRRELQALCKKNNIPANVTNVSMAASLKSLEIVEGIDEVFQTCESEMAQLSIEPRVRLEAASPFLPPTGGRSTRRQNAATEEASRRSTRTTMAKYANESQVDAFATPVALQTNRKKGQTASASNIKMDSLFKECAQDAALTPAPWGVASQRRRAAKEDSAVKQVQGTRRSARLAEKSVKMLKGENSVFSKNVLDEISGVTDVSASTNMEECSSKKDEEQVDSAEKQDIATDVEIVEENHEEMIQPEVVPCEKQVVSTAKKDEQVHSADNKHVVSTVEEVELVPSNEGQMSDSGLMESIGVNIEQVPFGISEASKDANIVMALAQEADGCGVLGHEYAEADVECEAEKINPDESDSVISETFLEDEKIIGQVFLGASTNLTESEEPSAKALNCVTPSFVENEAAHQLPIKLDSSPIIPPASTTQIRASAVKKRIVAAASDNKENITLKKDRSEVVKELTETFMKMDDQAIRHLTNEVKKLEINQKLDKNEGGNEVSARPALQLLHKNQ